MGATLDNSHKKFDVNLSFRDFYKEADFFDVTLAADSPDGSIQALKAHKIILSACSPVLRSLLKKQSMLNVHSQVMPVMLYLRGISAKGLQHILEFVYRGSISLAHEDLNDFLAVSESLQIPLLEKTKLDSGKRKVITNAAEKSKTGKLDIAESDPNSFPDNWLIKNETANSTAIDKIYEGGYEADGTDDDEIMDDELIACTSDEAQEGNESPSVDDLMQSKVLASGAGFTCTICGKNIKRDYHMRRHLEVHLSSDGDYYCPHCKKYCNNRQSIYRHVYKQHKDWKNVDYDSFAVK